ncbi:hypothetical protein POM88_026785 [Heracleum sosnowskyi]|uniref:Uncharacterized protein n=1 Tax=Heracleum sosnowskyi TaxID=360622 RepID=A0AAD8MNX7_9APIA|nr:hypothetical protein POM88_026785 [Heracleum sosnowskyi]
MAFNLNKEVLIFDINLPVSCFDDARIHIRTCITDFKDTVAVIISILIKSKINLWILDDEKHVFVVVLVELKHHGQKVLSIDAGVPLDFVEGVFNNVQPLLLEQEGCMTEKRKRAQKSLLILMLKVIRELVFTRRIQMNKVGCFIRVCKICRTEMCKWMMKACVTGDKDDNSTSSTSLKSTRHRRGGKLGV